MIRSGRCYEVVLHLARIEFAADGICNGVQGYGQTGTSPANDIAGPFGGRYVRRADEVRFQEYERADSDWRIDGNRLVVELDTGVLVYHGR